MTGEAMVPEDFVVDLARRISTGDVTHEEAAMALRLAADRGDDEETR